MTKQKQPVGEPYLLEFHGTECDHCVDMLPLVHKIEKELGVTMLKLEVSVIAT
jgi:thiol-disulfide isomerase/thioredoxin